MRLTQIEKNVKKEKIKLSIQYTFITLLIVVGLMVSFYFIYSNSIYKNFDASISQRAISIASTLSGEDELNIETLNSLNLSKSPFQVSNEIIEITNAKGKIFFSLAGINPTNIEIKPNSFSFGTYTEEVNNKKVLLKIRAYTAAVNNMPYYVTVARTYDDIKDTLKNIVISFLIIIPFIISIIGFASYKLASLAIAPIEESFRKLEQFTEDASHELKTPLSAIKANIDVALSKDVNETDYYKKKLTVINDPVNRMANIITSMLYLSKLDSGTIELKKEKININVLLEEVKERFSDAALKKNVEIEVSEEKNIEIENNKDALDMILSIIVENAINFNKQNGTVKIVARELDSEIQIDISDTGIGIAKEDLPHIFDRFYRGEKSRSRETGGAGLGLSIAYNLAMAIGARIEVKSNEGLDSTFTIIIQRGNNEWTV
jgi:signal transduction histidine kinase